MQPTPNQIKEIAEQLDCGFCCYYNIKTGELVSIPDEETMDDLEEFYGEDFAKIKKDKRNFILINKPSSRESFEIMEEFAQQLSNKTLSNQLLNALAKKSPFANFKSIIDGAGEYRQQWFDFKLMQLQDYVLDQIRIVK